MNKIEEKFINEIQRNNGITLMVLVITIVIILILVSITINISIGENGLIEKAKQAIAKYKNSQIDEQKQLDELYEQLNDLDNNFEISDDTTRRELLKRIEELENELKNSKNSVNYYNLNNGESVPIPKGFYYVGGIISSGVVISDSEEDFEKYKNLEDVPSGTEYNDDGTVNTELSELKGNQFVWIPCNVNDYIKILSFSKSGEFDQYTNVAENIQIDKYKGFYIGRYEAGTSELKVKNGHSFGEVGNYQFIYNTIESGKIHTKGGEIPYYTANYEATFKLSEEMYKNNPYVTSTLVTGTMWDATMKFITQNYKPVNNNYDNLISQIVGNYKDIILQNKKGLYFPFSNGGLANREKASIKNGQQIVGILTTGSTDETRVCNIYDLAGNQFERTEEIAVGNTISHIMRGGSFYQAHNQYPISSRYSYVDSYATPDNGFRPALFIN